MVIVRKRVHALLEAWRRVLLKQHAPDRHPDPPLPLHNGAFFRRQWDSGMRKLLAWQVQRTTGWGSAAAFNVRQRLVQHKHKRQQQSQEPMPQPEQGRQSGGRVGPAAAAGRRRSAQQQAQGDAAQQKQQQRQQQQHPPGGLSSGSDSAEEFSNLSESESDDLGSEYVDGSNGDDSDADEGADGGSGAGRRRKRARSAGARRQQGVDAQQQADDFEMSCAELEAWLEGFDDLMLPQESSQGSEAAGSGPSCRAAQGGSQPERRPWRPAANSVWTAVADSGRFAADDRGVRSGSDTRGNARVETQQGGAMATSAVEGWASLPEGVRLVLAQASKAGIAPVVLQRTARRLQEMLTHGQRDCNQG